MAGGMQPIRTLVGICLALNHWEPPKPAMVREQVRQFVCQCMILSSPLKRWGPLNNTGMQRFRAWVKTAKVVWPNCPLVHHSFVWCPM